MASRLGCSSESRWRKKPLKILGEHSQVVLEIWIAPAHEHACRDEHERLLGSISERQQGAAVEVNGLAVDLAHPSAAAQIQAGGFRY